MNWKFWQKKPAPVMTALEAKMLQDLTEHPESWDLRRPPVSNVLTARSRGVMVVSCVEHGAAVARCGDARFGTEFARRWHAVVEERVSKKEDLEAGMRRQAELERLEETFLKP